MQAKLSFGKETTAWTALVLDCFRRGCRVGVAAESKQLKPSRFIVYRLAALFSLDAFAGGFIVQSLVLYSAAILGSAAGILWRLEDCLRYYAIVFVPAHPAAGREPEMKVAEFRVSARQC
jgi:hypothetical protein